MKEEAAKEKAELKNVTRGSWWRREKQVQEEAMNVGERRGG